MIKNNLNLAINEAKSAFDQIAENIVAQLAKERGQEPAPTDEIAAKILVSEAFENVAKTKSQ